jgi:hypothetical protein
MSLKAEHEGLVVYIDGRVNQILEDGGDPQDLLMFLNEIADDLDESIGTFPKTEMEICCEQYEGFCFFIAFISLYFTVSKEFSPTYH